MTIAVCCVSPEGVVLGADSTASLMVPGGFHYLNHNQKVFEIGNSSNYGLLTWGLAACKEVSYRTYIASLADSLRKKPATSVIDVVNRWADLFWTAYSQTFAAEINHLGMLHAKGPHVVVAAPDPLMRTQQEEGIYRQLKLGLVVGFCIGGAQLSDHLPHAYEMIFDPLATKPAPVEVPMGLTRCWGTPKVFNRNVLGIDDEVKASILASSKWSGTAADLDALLANHTLYLPSLPIRDAIDFVYSTILTTIKTLKFSQLSQTCGGPIEVAVVTTDREFRWVSHKEWDIAIREGHSRWKT